MAKQEFLSKAGLEIYHEEVKEYIAEVLDSGQDIADDLAEVQMGLGKFNTSLSWNSDETVYTETWTYNGSNYKQILTEVSDTQWKKQLYVDDVLKGTWTMTLNETNMTANTVYVAS